MTPRSAELLRRFHQTYLDRESKTDMALTGHDMFIAVAGAAGSIKASKGTSGFFNLKYLSQVVVYDATMATDDVKFVKNEEAA